MPRGRRAWKLPSVEERTVHLTMELRVDDDALAGRVTAADGSETDFSGWLGLVATIEAQVAPTPAGAEASA
jgi:hypothetical protein